MTRTPPADAWWFAAARPSARPVDQETALRLFCFPYAGGGAQIFHNWQRHLPPEVEVCAVQLPGRGRRLREAAYNQIEPLVAAIAAALGEQWRQPFALFGHSMGALISFELARRLRQDYGVEPLHLFLSGCRAAHLGDDEPPIFNLPKAEFLAELTRLGGTDRAILENEELVNLLLPVLRADFELVETYRYLPGAPLSCPVTVFGGISDPEASPAQVAQWRQHTTGAFASHLFPGDHFFIHTTQNPLLQRLSAELSARLRLL